MAKDGKFGTFGGVFTPSILTILGVIMYMRLPWVAGNAGLTMALGIVLVAHVISVTTGLSISSIATDKKVGAGGPYYIISRSFGLPIGGAIGGALFLGLSLSISLYLVGFSESFLASIGVEPTKNAIRVCGSITIVAITIITFISTSLAIKTQYAILVVIAASLASIFLGSATSSEPHLSAATESPSFAVLFGIFFPAVTGFTAGVNMSGDLRDPKGSIPRGTMLAIGAGFAIYVGMVVYLCLRVDPSQLRGDPQVLEHTALWGPAVVAGIWSATLSSAMGCILGAPRILQAMSADRITPRALAKGYGPTSEPRNALFVAFAIGEGGILIAELDLIARVVSMVFLAMYAAVNITCAMESWAGSDFRPRFKNPRIVSIIGAVTAILLMIQLDLIAMLAATVFMLVIFGVLKRRQLTLEAGDTWEGIWSSVVRTGLQRLARRAGDRRNWRPNVLLFDEAGHARHGAIREFATTLASGNGLVTDFALGKAKAGAEAGRTDPTEVAGVFDRRIVTEHPLETAATLCQHHGFAGLAPNTVLLPWRQHRDAPDAYLRVLRTAAGAELNLLLFEEARDASRNGPPRIDVWWSRDAGNLAFAVALVRFITRAEHWERATVNVLIAGDDVEEDELLRAKAVRFLDDSRVDGKVRLVSRPRTTDGYQELVARESRDARLVLHGLPADLERADRETLARLERIAELPGGVVFIKAAASFSDVLTAAPVRRRRAPTAPEDSAEAAPEAPAERVLPAHPQLADAATAIDAALATTANRIQDRTIARGYTATIALCDAARALVMRRADALIAAAAEKNPARRKKLVASATSAFVTDAAAALARFQDDDVAALATALGEEGPALADATRARDAVPPAVRITRPRAELRAREGESLTLRRWKRGKRWRYFYRRQIPLTIAVGDLARYCHDRLVCDAVVGALAGLSAHTHAAAAEVGRVLANAEWKATAELSRSGLDDTTAIAERLTRSRDAALERLAALREQARERIAADRAAIQETRQTVADYIYVELDRVDAPVAAEAARHRDRADAEALAGLHAAAEAWRTRQLAMLKRIRLAVRLAGMRSQLATTTVRHLDEITTGLHGSGLRACTELREALAGDAGGKNGTPLEVREELPYEPAPVLARFARAAATITAALPESETVLTDEAAAESARSGALEQVNVTVRSSVQGLVEADLIARLQVEVTKLVEADTRAWTAARDTVRLLSAQQGAAADDDDEGAGAAGATVEHSLGRLDGQVIALREAEAAFVRAAFDGLESLSHATGLDRFATALDADRRAGDREGPSRVRAAVRRGAAGVRELAARAIYRRSAGVVFAHEARASRERAATLTIRELVTRSSVPPSVLATVPLSYRHLFTGQININEAFFVGRRDRVDEGRRVLAGDRGTAPRAVLVSGDRGSGKTTLCQQLTAATTGPVTWVPAPAPGAIGRRDLRGALEAAIGASGAPAQLIRRLDPGAIVVIDDLDLWWERRAGGLEAIDEILDLVEDAPEHIGFVLGGGAPAIAMLDALRSLSRVTAAHLECQPLTARELQEVVIARHASTGMRMQLGRRQDDAIGAWGLARLFDRHFDYSRGNVGYALRAWIAHVDGFAEDTVTLRAPDPLDWDLLDDLRPELVAMLVEVLLHRSAGIDKLSRVTGRPAAAVREAVAELGALGLTVQNRRRAVQINPYVHVPLVAWLERKELA